MSEEGLVPLQDTGVEAFELLPAAKPVVSCWEEWTNYSQQQQVRALAVETDGALWVATSGGVLCWHRDDEDFTLHFFTRYTSTHGLPSNDCRTIVLAGGRVWVLGAGQLAIYEAEQWHGVTLPSLPDTPIAPNRDLLHCLGVSPGQVLWAAGENALYKVHSPTFIIAYPYPEPVFSPVALAVAEDETVWLGTGGGIFAFRAEAWVETLATRGLLALACYGTTLWVGTARRLYQINPTAGTRYTHPTWEGTFSTLSPVEGGVYVGWNGRLGYADSKGLVLQKQLPLSYMPHPTITALVAPSRAHRHFWIGTPQGLFQYHPRPTDKIYPYHSQSAPDVLSGTDNRSHPLDHHVQSLAYQPTTGGGRIWLGTAHGLYAYEPRATRWVAYNDITLRDVRHLTGGKDGGTIWGNCRAGGLVQIVSNGVPQLHSSTFPPTMTALSYGNDGHLWLAVTDVLLREERQDGIFSSADEGQTWQRVLTGATIRRYGVPDSALVQSLLVQPALQQLWLGTTAGVYLWDIFRQQLRQPMRTQATEAVRVLIGMGEEDVIIGTERGLYYWTHATETCHPLLENQVIKTAMWDPTRSCLWVGTEAGLYQLQPPPMDTHAWTIHHERAATSGLPSDHITALAIEPAIPTPRLWVGTVNGVGVRV